MALFDKFKKILFDEDEIEVEETENTLPVRETKKEKVTEGFVDHHANEDTIEEVKLPKEDETPVVDEPIMTRSRLYDYGNDFDDDVKEPVIEEIKPRVEERIPEPRRVESPRKYDEISEYERPRRMEHIETHGPVKNNDIKDYKKIVHETHDETKKPFKVTPVISPVYGILDKNYKPEEVIIKTPEPKNDGPREFGPVSYNGDPLPQPITYKREEVKEVEEVIPTPVVAEEVPRLKEEIEEVVRQPIGNSIEDEFEPTNEYKTVNEESNVSEFDEELEETLPSIEDAIDEEKEPTVDINQLIQSTEEFTGEESESVNTLEDTSSFENPIKTREEEIEEENNLDETIETDLFNLIDSMYKDDEKESA